LQLLDDRLDDEVAAREVGERRRRREARERGLPLLRRHPLLIHLPLEEVGDARGRRVSELVGHLAPDDLVTGLDGQLRDPAAHGAQADHADRADLGSAHRARS
jgi:hypothetical protein